MKKYENNHFNNIQKENLNKNLPNTPSRKSSILKESNPKIKQNFKNRLSNKGQTEKINTKKNSKLYSSSILNKREKIENKNHNVKKNIKSFSNSREFKNNTNGKNIYYNDYNNNFNKKNDQKKTDYLFFLENYKIKKTQNKQDNEKNPENQNKINKTQSFVNSNNNNNLSYYSYNYVTNTAKNAINSSVKNSQKSGPSSLLLQKKLKEEKRIQNKSNPITLIQSSKDKKAKSKEKNHSNRDILIKKNFQINTTHVNNYNNSKFNNSNFFLKNTAFSNKTCSNDYLYSNDLIRSEKNPIVIKEKILKYNKSTKNKEIKKSQSQSHIFYQKTKTENILKNNDKKMGKKYNNLSTKKILRNKGTNFNLNINNINNFNNKFLFNCDNLNKSTSKPNKKSQKNAIL